VKISIIGLGFVGLSFAAVLGSKNYSVLGIDNDTQKILKIKNNEIPFYEPKLKKFLNSAQKKSLTVSDDLEFAVRSSDLIFITVSTPSLANGEINLKSIKNVIIEIGKNLKKTKNKPLIIIKSTVIPETSETILLPLLEKFSQKSNGKDFGFITNPEFLREGRSIDDTLNPHIIVLGGKKNDYMKKLKKFYSLLHKKTTPLIITNYSNAELIKYANNSFLATKISFINQLSNICQNIPGANIDDIAKTIGLDPRIGRLFLNAGPGYGGSCLPKDMKALINFADKIGINPTLLNAVEQTNKKQIQNIILLIEKTLGSLENKHIAILGTAFKPNTDDIRDSIAIELIKKLLKKKVDITVYDPKAIKNTKIIFGEKIKYASSISNSLKNSQCAIIMVHWKQFEKINKNSTRLMKRKFIIDCRRVLSKKQLNFEYHAIGIGKI